MKTADGRHLRNVSATWLESDDEVWLTVTDRAGSEVYTANVMSVTRAGSQWTLETDEGIVLVRRGCACGGRR